LKSINYQVIIISFEQDWELDDKEEAESDDEAFETPPKKKKKSVEIDNKKNKKGDKTKKKEAKKVAKEFYEQDSDVDGDLLEQDENEYLDQSDAGEDNDGKENSGGDRKRKRQFVTTSTPVFEKLPRALVEASETPSKHVKTEFPCDFCEGKFGRKANLEVKLQLSFGRLIF
jgi:hypothetical protein